LNRVGTGLGELILLEIVSCTLTEDRYHEVSDGARAVTRDALTE